MQQNKIYHKDLIGKALEKIKKKFPVYKEVETISTVKYMSDKIAPLIYKINRFLTKEDGNWQIEAYILCSQNKILCIKNNEIILIKNLFKNKAGEYVWEYKKKEKTGDWRDVEYGFKIKDRSGKNEKN